jgi:hypothetical protein
VELVGVAHDSSEYETLHERMRTAGFSRTFVSGGHTYKLPPGEYLYFERPDTAIDAREVVTKALQAAGGITASAPRVVATHESVDSGSFAWINLELKG